MRKRRKKARIILYTIAILFWFLYTVGILVLYAKFDDLENVHVPISIFVTIIIAGIIFNLFANNKNND